MFKLGALLGDRWVEHSHPPVFKVEEGPRGKVIDYRVPIEINGVRIESGDVVFGDTDGVCIIPRNAEDEVFRRALEKARGEKLVAKAIREGMGAVEAFERFGIM